MSQETAGDLLENQTHTFIFKIWLEATREEMGHAEWRGRITHVASGERQYVMSLEEAMQFIAPYLKQLGVEI